ncbi:soul heme-binding protein [Candidatus Marinamargulisbacteria bacterium SCGC AAA071-K20]|nr:soul heme-binding protein [Candidatus Marinamargulisbacteria bacterium SCGC AAA071-K20]
MKILLFSVTCLLLIWSLFTFFTETKIEKPLYRVIEKRDGYEIRKYESFLVATTPTEGDFNESVSQGFRVLAGYIFGGNDKDVKIKMTAPVTETVSDTGKSVQFMIPKEYTMDTLPKPNNDLITFKFINPKKMASLSFKGYAKKSRVDHKKELLLNHLKKDNLTALSQPIYAGYNSPFAFPLMRRNEILVEIE